MYPFSTSPDSATSPISTRIPSDSPSPIQSFETTISFSSSSPAPGTISNNTNNNNVLFTNHPHQYWSSGPPPAPFIFDDCPLPPATSSTYTGFHVSPQAGAGADDAIRQPPLLDLSPPPSTPSPPVVQMHRLSLTSASSSPPSYHLPGPVMYVNPPNFVQPQPRTSGPSLTGWSGAPSVSTNNGTSVAATTSSGHRIPPSCPPMQPKIPPQKGRKSFPCGWQGCPMKFPKQNALAMHLRSHTGERPEICKWCDRGFSLKCNLRRHWRTCKSKKAMEAKKPVHAGMAGPPPPSPAPSVSSPSPVEEPSSPGASSSSASSPATTNATNSPTAPVLPLATPTNINVNYEDQSIWPPAHFVFPYGSAGAVGTIGLPVHYQPYNYQTLLPSQLYH